MNRISSILQVIAALVVLTAASGGVSGEICNCEGLDLSLKQTISGASMNLTSYSYAIDAVADVQLSSGTNDWRSNISSRTAGAVDIARRAAALHVTNWRDGGVIRERSSYLVNDTLYSSAGQGWQKQVVPNTTQAMFTFDEMRGQSSMLVYSEMGPAGSDEVDGRRSIKVVSTPSEEIRGMLIRGQIMGAYFTLAGKTLNLTIDDVISNSQLMNGSTVRLTTWIDQETGVLVRNEMNVVVDVQPDVLRLPWEERLRIDLTQTSAFSGFDQPAGIELPDEAVNAVYPDGGNGGKKDCLLCNKEITA